MAAQVGYALVGCGAFGQFCLEQYASLPNVKLVAVTDNQDQIARTVAERFSLEYCATLEELVARRDVDIIHIATPPATHCELALKILDGGKHVLCEKPLATTVPDARRMLAAAESAQKLLVVNLVMRYDPLTPIVRKVIQERLLGEPLHGMLENYASDEKLPPDHWFWNPRQSGGIFIEHGVHFFDLFESWLGRGEVLAAAHTTRPGNETIVDQVQCLCRLGENVLTSFYHGFHQAGSMDRQEFRIVFERGDVRLFEWLPTSIRIEANLTKQAAGAIAAMLNEPRVTELQHFEADRRRAHSHHRDYEVDGYYLIQADAGMQKAALYGHVVRSLLDDQVKAILDPQHTRILDESAGLRSLEIADQATVMANANVARIAM